MKSFVFCFATWCLYCGVVSGQRVREGLLAEYLFSQCECAGDGNFSDSAGVAPNLVKTGLSSCDFKEGFTSPASQGILLDTTAESSDTFALISGDDSSDTFTFTPSNGITLEHWLLPKDLILESGRSSLILSEIRSNSPDISVDFPNFGCSIAFDSEKPSDLQVLYNSFLISEPKALVFSLNVSLQESKDEPLHVVCGMKIVSESLTPFACLNGDCQSDDSIAVELESFESNSKLNCLSNLAVLDDSVPPESLQLLTLQVYNRALSTDEVLQNFNDTSILRSVPVMRNDLFITSIEDDFVSFNIADPGFFFDNDDDPVGSVRTTISLLGGFVAGSGIEFASIGLPKGVFTSRDKTCDRNVDGDFLPLATVAFAQEDNECSLPPEPVQVCIVELNDAPESVPETNVQLGLFSESVAFSFVPGSDLDDDVSLSLSGQKAGGGLMNGGFITISSASSGQLLEFDDGCTENVVAENSTVDIQSDGRVLLCYLSNSLVENDSFTFLLSDALESQNETFSNVSMEFVNLVSPCNEESSCAFSTKENTDLPIVFPTIVADESPEPLLVLISKFPRHGRLFTDSTKATEILQGFNDLFNLTSRADNSTFELSLTFEPEEFYFNANENGMAVNGLGNLICDDGLASCPETIDFVVSFRNEVKTAEISILVTAVNNEASDLNLYLPKLNLEINNETSIVDAFSIDAGDEGDMDAIEVRLSSSDSFFYRLDKLNLANQISVTSLCSETEFCAEETNLKGFPSEINKLLSSLSVVGRKSGEAALTVRVDDVTVQSKSLAFNVIKEETNESNGGLIVGVLGGVVVLAGVGAFAIHQRKKGINAPIEKPVSGEVQEKTASL